MAELTYSASRQFAGWLEDQKTSVAFTTYQAGSVFWLGLKSDGNLGIFTRSVDRAMALQISPQSMYLSTLYQIWRFENALEAGHTHEGYDRVYVPQIAWTTGDLDVHDIDVDADGRPVFVNTLFGCIATVSERHSFVPIWRPPFLSKLAAEDRCHLNGLAMEDGEPRFATAVSRSDVGDGWREHRTDGGVVIDVRNNETVGTGLSMPHSPRLYRGRLWLLDSGNGYFGYLDLNSGRFERVAFCPGYARGLSFIGDYAVVGVSRPRGQTISFEGLALGSALAKRQTSPRCGLQIIDLRSGDAVHWFRLDGQVSELYDVGVIPGVRQPMAIGFKSDEIRRILSVGP